jgi:hypothetical protein
MIKRKKHFSFATAVVAGWRASGGEETRIILRHGQKEKKNFYS